MRVLRLRCAPLRMTPLLEGAIAGQKQRRRQPQVPSTAQDWLFDSLRSFRMTPIFGFGGNVAHPRRGSAEDGRRAFRAPQARSSRVGSVSSGR
jgi:hypothetical protein